MIEIEKIMMEIVTTSLLPVVHLTATKCSVAARAKIKNEADIEKN